MTKQDIEFEILDHNKSKVNCCVLATVPIDEYTINIMYKREDDKDDVFRYGKIIKTEDSYIIKKDLSDEEYINLRECFNDEIINIANNCLKQMEVK